MPHRYKDCQAEAIAGGDEAMNLTQCIRAGDKNGRSGFLIAFNYDQETVETLKRVIPHTEREWHEDSKTWWVSVRFEDTLKLMFKNFEALVYLQGKLL